jgi:protein-disulfide isomerase
MAMNTPWTLVLAAAVWLMAFSPPVPTRNLVPTTAPDPLAARTKGRATAPVTVYEMADFQCPACRQFFLTSWPALERSYVATGKVRWIFVNFPLTSNHPNAMAAAEVAMCAARQLRFWPMHDLLFRHQPTWAPLDDPQPLLRRLAVDSAHVRRDSLTACLRTGMTRQEIEDDTESARRSGAHSTPSFYVEGGMLDGAWPAEQFGRVLDSIYRVKTSRPR